MSLTNVLTFQIKDLDGSETSNNISLHLSNSISNELDTKNYIIHKTLLIENTNGRKRTANTKTRAEVRGGGRKPWRQKGTGRARAGSNRSPLWRGGGVSFGPKSKKSIKKINKKEWRISLNSLLIKKQTDIIVINNFDYNSFKTKDFIKQIQNLNIQYSDQIVIVVPTINENLKRGTSNLPNVKLMLANNLNIKKILAAKYIVILKDSLKIIEEMYNV
uniref:Large ribosomal subunit protein uL4c n=1 Tax=Schizocladia ischiensis TaxID=196139 RepID=A0A7S6U9X4_9STRA|nr:ribosomal protein L4 [Schizocladia ischiensis]QOW07535.1 ribosomal protein L4 [Schizocladia ischiensis]